MSVTSRAARVDLQIAKGVDFGVAVQMWTPDVQVAVETLVAGQQVWYDDLPERVYAVKLEPNRVTVQLRDGLFSDPWFQARPGQLIFIARARPITEAKASYQLLVDPPEGWEIKFPEIPSQIGGGDTVQLAMDSVQTLALQTGAFSWDLTVVAEGTRIRLVEGTLSVITSESNSTDYVWPSTTDVLVPLP